MVIRRKTMVEVKQRADGTPVLRERNLPTVLHTDIIREEFWQEYPHLMAP